jgi:hypothetical protein
MQLATFLKNAALGSRPSKLEPREPETPRASRSSTRKAPGARRSITSYHSATMPTWKIIPNGKARMTP